MKKMEDQELREIISRAATEMRAISPQISELESQLRALRKKFTTAERLHHDASMELALRRSLTILQPRTPKSRIPRKKTKETPREVLVALLRAMPESELRELLAEEEG